MNGRGYVKALDAEEKRCPIHRDGLFKNGGCHSFLTLLKDLKQG
jgi:hypothetical protein